MQLNKFSDYSLRVLIFLETMDAEKTTAQIIADTYGISFHHVAKACQWLVREGYVESGRGRNGGIALAKPAETINIGDILVELEANSVLVECHKAEGGGCCISPACGLQMALADAQAAFFNTLRQFTLANITYKKSSLQKLLRNAQDTA